MELWIVQVKTPVTKCPPPKRILEGTINCIHDLIGQHWANQLHSKLYRPSPSLEVKSVQLMPKRKRDPRDTWAITFTE